MANESDRPAERPRGVVEVFYPPLVPKMDPRKVRERFWPKVWKTLGVIPFSEDIAAAFYCAVDSRTPTRVKVVLMGALAYFVLPADMVPDLLVGVGFTDDATVLATALGVVGAHIKPRHRRAARERLGKPEPAADADD
jgi:uncharacterized membrane protein YkvA (DUF1232 family)